MNRIFKKASTIRITVSALLVLSFANRNPFDTVKVQGGIISGTVNAAGDIHVFRGIPFAAAPVGELRWKAPQPVVPWNGVKKCDAFGPSPMQRAPVPFGPWSKEFLIPEQPISEDCLYLNVWTGARTAHEKRPVLVWIYGGGFVSGGSSVPIYNGEAMAEKGVVFVSINYRVGVFGSFSLPELTKESPWHSSGNYGLLDQIAALRWVKNNIAAFGGDPNRVTVAGQSAGSMSVNCLVASPLCKGLFQRAIGESGAEFVGDGPPSLQTVEKAGLQFQNAVGAASLQELRKLPAKELMAKRWNFSFPIVDGHVLPRSIRSIYARDQQNKVALLTGWNEDDGVIFGKPATAKTFEKEIDGLYGKNAPEVFRYYPADNDPEAEQSQRRWVRDHQFGIQNYMWASMHAKESGRPVYLYRFTRKLPATGEYARYGAFHTGEVPYAYGNLDSVKRCTWQPVDDTLQKIMTGYWVNFARTGNPNGKGLPDWPAYQAETKMTMMLGNTVRATRLPDATSLEALISASASQQKR